MNRSQAIEQAKNLRRKTTVFVLDKERVAAVQAVAEVKDAQGTVIKEAVEAVKAAPRQYIRFDYESVSAAKRKMREYGRGVALLDGETLPK